MKFRQNLGDSVNYSGKIGLRILLVGALVYIADREADIVSVFTDKFTAEELAKAKTYGRGVSQTEADSIRQETEGKDLVLVIPGYSEVSKAYAEQVVRCIDTATTQVYVVPVEGSESFASAVEGYGDSAANGGLKTVIHIPDGSWHEEGKPSKVIVGGRRPEDREDYLSSESVGNYFPRDENGGNYFVDDGNYLLVAANIKGGSTDRAGTGVAGSVASEVGISTQTLTPGRYFHEETTGFGDVLLASERPFVQDENGNVWMNDEHYVVAENQEGEKRIMSKRDVLASTKRFFGKKRDIFQKGITRVFRRK